ncbi:MAG TPA: ATP-binding protein, partial [Euzebya sp.]|nr:ATP-binding protein [Euzebya sp.]
QQGQFAEFGQEYFFVRTYLTLEQARFGERLGVHYDIDPQVLTAQVPVLVIQPLVENAVKHGLAPKVEGGTVTLKARADPLSRTTTVVVIDDGVGMTREEVDRLFDPSPAADGRPGNGGGIALVNIEARLSQLFGARHTLRVESAPGEGTKIELRMPLT